MVMPYIYRIVGYFQIKNFVQVSKHQFHRFLFWKLVYFEVAIVVQLYVHDAILRYSSPLLDNTVIIVVKNDDYCLSPLAGSRLQPIELRLTRF